MIGSYVANAKTQISEEKGMMNTNCE